MASRERLMWTRVAIVATLMISVPFLASAQGRPATPFAPFKRVGRFWSARVGLHYRAIAVESPDGLLWLWIGTHADYDKLVG